MEGRQAVADLLWGSRATGSRGPKPALTLERIAEVAVGVADAEGLGAVSMQRVAGELGFTKMALYRYLPGKTELIALMLEHAIGGPPDLHAMTWRPGLRAWAHALLAAHLRHPWTIEAVLMPRPVGPNELTWTEAAIALLAHTGLTATERLDTVVVLVGQVRIIAQQAHASTGSEGKILDAMADLVAVHRDRFPALARTTTEAATADGRNGAFDFGLERILDGLQSLTRHRERSASGGA
jgi:AcrR family transcriptional regulator